MGLSYLFTIFIISSLYSQPLTHLWTGLRVPQPVEELPKSNAPFQTANRIPKLKVIPELRPVNRNEWVLSKGWEMIDAEQVTRRSMQLFDPKLNTDLWYNATVPGTVLTSLVAQGVYPDPYYGLNNMAIPDTLSRMHWWYRTTFSTPENTDGKQLYLEFNGINYLAEVYLNGNKLGNIKGAFIRGKFNITSLANKNGTNVLAVLIHPNANPGIPHEQSVIAGQGLNGGVLSQDGPTFISSIGWDWVPGIRDRNAGIWQDVRLRLTNDVQIGDPLIVTRLALPDTSKATVDISTDIKNTSANTVSGILRAHIGEQNYTDIPYSLLAGETKTIHFSPQLIQHPRLWWPNGYGKPNLYNLKLEALQDGILSDQKTLRFGIRELSYELMVNTGVNNNVRMAYTPNKVKNPGKPIFNYQKRVYYTKDNQLATLYDNADTSGLQRLSDQDPVGPYLVIRVNGKRIFCRGGNWGMDDAMKRVNRERLEPYFKLHKELNFNIIRNWTGESTEESFYSLCDEYGMLVWNDFWITTDDTVEPSDIGLFLNNARDVVRRFRNHPSLAIWCPRNEGFAPADMAEELQKMMASEDPTRHYHGQSRHLNMGTSGPWGYFKDPSLYYTQNAKGFLTEIGTYSIPTAETIKKFIPPADQWPINDVWAYHDLHHTSQNFKDFMTAVAGYGPANNLDDFSKKAQFVCYDAWRNIMEAWNSKMWNNTTGQILWMSHPAWPSMIWQTYTYDYETPGSYFGAKKASEPLHIQMNLPDNRVVVINNTLKDISRLKASIKIFDLSGKLLSSHNTVIKAKANSLTNCFESKDLAQDNEPLLARLELKDAKGRVTSVNDYWIKSRGDSSLKKLNDLKTSQISITKKSISKKSYALEVVNTGKNIAAGIKLNAIDAVSGNTLLPAYFSDGYFNLLPGEKRMILLELPAQVKSTIGIRVSSYN